MKVSPLRRLSARIIDYGLIVLARISLLIVFGEFIVPFSHYLSDGGFDEFLQLFFSARGAGIPFLVLVIVYLEFGIAILPNSLGRCVMGIQVVDYSTGERPTAGQAWQRNRSMQMWLPINLVMLFLGDEGRHIGDRSAGTKVVCLSKCLESERRKMEDLQRF